MLPQKLEFAVSETYSSEKVLTNQYFNTYGNCSNLGRKVRKSLFNLTLDKCYHDKYQIMWISV